MFLVAKLTFFIYAINFPILDLIDGWWLEKLVLLLVMILLHLINILSRTDVMKNNFYKVDLNSKKENYIYTALLTTIEWKCLLRNKLLLKQNYSILSNIPVQLLGKIVY